MTEINSAEGQSAMDSMGATGAESVGNEDQSVVSNQTTGNGSGDMTEQSFFDPKEIAGTPLEAAYKQMQGAFTKKMQSVSADQHKIDAYNAFEQNPTAVLQQLASQYGFQLLQPGSQQQQDFEPQTWDEVMERARKEVFDKDVKPLLNEIQSMKRSNMETYLDTNYPDWRTYEQDMISLLKEHPTLSKKPDLLYDLAIPPEIKQARATKAAMKKINGQTEATAISGKSTTTKNIQQSPEGIKSLDDAVSFARQTLAAKGIRPPSF